MKWNPSTFFFLLTIIFSVFLTIRSNNYFINWVSLELSLLGFIPLFGGKIIFISDTLTKYFCVQVFDSSLYLFSSIVSINIFLKVLLPLRLMLKLGLFPFIAWMPLVINIITWLECLILNTLQKINPLFILRTSNFNEMNSFVILLRGVIRVLLSAILGFNQSNLRPLIAFSSISHTAWIVSIMKFRFTSFMFYIALYYLLTLYLFFRFNKSNVKKISSLNKIGTTEAFLLITLRGIPPFPIFFIKLVIIIKIVTFRLFPATALVLGAALSSYYYFYIVIPMLINKTTS